ncbi:MAG: response regulator [Noviherbaspirillum sp.]
MDQAAIPSTDLPESDAGARALLSTLAAFCAEDLSVRMPAGDDAASRTLGATVNAWLETVSGLLYEFTRVVTAISEGRLEQPMPLEINGRPLSGPLLQLAERVDRMRSQLARLSAEVGRITHEVGVEGRLGGQASLPDGAGAWRDMVDGVNSLAASLTGRVRAISGVASAIARGDLSCDLRIEASGELALLRDNINALICSLRERTRQNAEQDWLKTNLARFARLLQGQRSIAAVAQMVMAELAPLMRMQHGLFYILDHAQLEAPRVRLAASYAAGVAARLEWRIGEGLIGQCAQDRKPLFVTDVPAGHLTIRTGLGATTPGCLLVQPILFENDVKAVLELASFTPFSAIQLSFLDQLSESIGVVLHTIEASMRTENLLQQAQSLAQELQSQQEALSKSNASLQEKAVLLQRQKAAMEVKNQEVEMTRMSLEEKAEQLMLSSRYKSEFLSSMSHELRTPLNSLLILARQLSENSDNNLTPRQVEYASTIHSAGEDLLNLINEILDLAKIESGTVKLALRDVPYSNIEEQLLRIFNPIAQSRGLGFAVKRAAALPASLHTDETRLLQVLRNLLANGFKFSEHGGVTLSIDPVRSGWTSGHEMLDAADMVVAFKVSDTGIGIAPDQRALIFEPFQQGDAGTSRRYGGTGLGLSISAGLARLMQGELRLVASEPGAGSSFALYLPQQCAAVWQTPPRAEPTVSPAQCGAPATAQAGDDHVFPRRIVLVVDDDVRNIFALTGVLEHHGMEVWSAESGRTAIDMLHQRPGVDIVLMDIMMPDMDGFDTMRHIRRIPAFNDLPIIALTAKAMQGDREKCIAAGASDYVSKPVNIEELLALMRNWLTRP